MSTPQSNVTNRGPYTKGLLIIFGLILFGVVGTLVIERYDLDLIFTSMCYSLTGEQPGWVSARGTPWGQLYEYGEIPGLVLMVCAALGYLGVRLGRIPDRYRKPCLVMALSVIIGPGLVVNGILKPLWGRPRPADTYIFQGQSPYRQPWQVGTPGSGKSFTCGHCAMGYVVSSGVALYPIHPGIAVASCVTGIAFGTILGIARVFQGGHFPSDVLWSAVIVFVTITVLYYLVFPVPPLNRMDAGQSSGTDGSRQEA